MHTPKARLAAVITALASLTFVGAALAQEPDDPELAEEVTPVECVDDTTDDTVGDPAEGTEDTTADDTTADDTTADDTTADDTTADDAEDDACEDEPAPEGDAIAPAVEDAVEEQADDVAPAVDGEWENHGAYVSEQARVGCWEASEEYANHGECVREAAHSDVGKPASGDAVEDDAGDPAPAAKAKAAGSKGRGKR